METKQKKRRKPIPCALCTEETLDLGGVCYKCRRIFNDGKRALAEIEREEKPRSWTNIFSHIRLYGNAKDDTTTRYGDLLVQFVDAIKRFANVQTRRGGSGSVDTYIHFDSSDGYDTHGLLLTDDQANALREIVSIIRAVSRKSYLEGLDEGSRLLVGLAQGKTTIGEFNENESKVAHKTQTRVGLG